VNVDLFGERSTVDDGARDGLDFYETPAFMTLSLLNFAPDLRGRVLECASGRDAIVRVLDWYGGFEIFTNDIDPLHPSQTHFDATEESYWLEQAPPVDWVISNLPFGVTWPIAKFALAHASKGLVLLQRKTWLEPPKSADNAERAQWLHDHTPTRWIGEPRYSFRGSGSDSVSCYWMIWDKDEIPRRSYIDHVACERTYNPNRPVIHLP
jgi:hypothetical protein